MNKTLTGTRVAIWLVLSVFLLSSLGGLHASAAESGSCGADLAWSYSAGTLTITGSGEMTNYYESTPAPWHHLRSSITAVILPDGLTSIGSLAFYDCTSLTAISVPDTVRVIAAKAFYGCISLRLADLPSQLSKIEKSAFYSCEKLSGITFPISLEFIGEKAFFLCRSLVTVTIPRYAETIGAQAFAYCENLMRVKIEANITAIPEWAFYGCTSLAEIQLPSTVSDVDFYAFKRCDGLTNVYHSGSDNNVAAVRAGIIEDVPSFSSGGYVGSGELSEITYSSSLEHNENDELISQTNTTVLVKPEVTVVTTVKKDSAEDDGKDSYSTSVSMTVSNGESWDEAADALNQTLGEINDTYSKDSNSKGTTLTVYLNDTSTVDESFLRDLTGRDMMVEVVTPAGSVWRNDFSALGMDDVSGNAGFSYTVAEAADESRETLGTDQCYQVTFGESSELNTEVLIRLPDSAEYANAFLYQIEKDGTHTRLQSTAVDGDNNAHFYLSSVDSDTKYVVGVNVPGENVDDVIIPDDLSDVRGAILRLEKIDYVSTGVRSFQGFTLVQVILMAIGVLFAAGIVVGVVMFMLNKRKRSYNS